MDTISVAHRLQAVQQGLVLCPNCVPENLDINQKGVNKKQYSHKKTKDLNVSKAAEVCIPKLKWYKLRTGVKCKGAVRK
jgi:hypothetical protein